MQRDKNWRSVEYTATMFKFAEEHPDSDHYINRAERRKLDKLERKNKCKTRRNQPQTHL